MASKKQSIVLFPFMAQGHIIPFLALAFHISKTKDYNIIFVNTPLNIKKLKSSLLSSSNSSIRLVEIPFDSSDHGLPPNSENTDILSYPLIIRLLHASTTLDSAFRDLIKNLSDEQEDGQPPLCVIADIFFGWTATVCKEMGIFHAVFSGASGFGMACYYSVWLSLPHRNTKSDDFELQDFKEVSKIHKTQLPLSISEADGTDSWSVFQKKNLPAWVDSNGILFNTIQEFDQLGLSYFKRKLNRPVWAIGPVLLPSKNRNQEPGISSDLCKKWLDSKPENSVLYISFGSNNTISPSQMMQLAMGLEASGKNFIWVVRPPLGFDINSEFKPQQWLPNGFEERIKESKRGLLVQKWANQLEILNHKSISAFLSHCGWNSVLEALNCGVPLIGWAMAGEQFFNVKFLEEELGVCVEVARGKTCEVRFEDIKEKIDLVMDSEKGKEIRKKAFEVKEMIEKAINDDGLKKGSSVKGLDDFFQAAMLAMEEKKTEKKKKKDQE